MVTLMYQNVYNIMAIIIRRLLTIEKKTPGHLRNYRAYKRDGARQKLKRLFPVLFKENSCVFREIASDEMDEGDWNRVETFAANSEEPFLLIELLLGIDGALRNRVRMEIEIFRTCNTISSLNSNFEETKIYLLPYMEALWERKSRGRQHSYDINGYLGNFIFIDEQELRKFSINDIRHVWLSSLLFQTAKDRGYLRVGFSPLSRHLKLNVSEYYKDNIRYFSVDSRENSEKVKQLVLSVLEKAKKEKVDILLFPEMIGSTGLVDAVTERLENYFGGEEEEYPSLIFLPSVWENHQNFVVVLTRDGERICTQKKQYPYDGPVEPGQETAIEDIDPDRTLYLIHCRGLGRIAVMICKDFLMEEYLDLVLQILKARLILVPSMSTGEYDFKTHANVCEHLDCCVIQCNCCSAEKMIEENQRDKLNTIGYVLKSGKNQNPRYVNIPSDGIIQITKPKLCREGGCEEACLFYEDFFFDKNVG